MDQNRTIPVWAKIANILMLVICYTPYIYLLAFYSLVLHLVLAAGGLPSNERQIPKGVSFEDHYVIISHCFSIVLYALLFFLVLLLGIAPKNEFYVKKIHCRIYITGLVLIFLHFFDPFFLWYVD